MIDTERFKYNFAPLFCSYSLRREFSHSHYSSLGGSGSDKKEVKKKVSNCNK
jgi:hypothetical protein